MSSVIGHQTNEGRRNFLKASLGLALTSSGGISIMSAVAASVETLNAYVKSTVMARSLSLRQTQRSVRVLTHPCR